MVPAVQAWVRTCGARGPLLTATAHVRDTHNPATRSGGRDTAPARAGRRSGPLRCVIPRAVCVAHPRRPGVTSELRMARQSVAMDVIAGWDGRSTTDTACRATALEKRDSWPGWT